MAAPTDNEKILANRITDALALLKMNGADIDEQEYYVGETLAEYRQTLVPHGKSAGQRVDNHKHRYDEHWKHADGLVRRGHIDEARKYIRKHVKPEHVLPNSKLVIRVMLALLDSESSITEWSESERSGG